MPISTTKANKKSTTPENTGTAFYAPGDAYTSWVWQDFAGSYGLNNWLTPDGPMYNFNQPEGSSAGDSTFNTLQDHFFKNYDAVQNPSNTPVLADCRWVGGWPTSGPTASARASGAGTPAARPSSRRCC